MPPIDKPVYTGERLTLNFQDIETRAVLQLLADASGQNIVVSDSVNGSVTLRLQNVPWDQALDIVLRTKGLDKRRQDNVIIVAPQAELAAREKAELAARKDVQELEPLRSEYLQVNYAKAAELANLVKTNTNSLLSPRGSVSVDERTNTLLLMDTSDRLADIRRLVATLDIPVRQVQIEARIVIVNDDFQRQLGARFGFTNVQQNGNTGLVTTTGTAAGTDQIIGSAINNVQGQTRRRSTRSRCPRAPPPRRATTSTCRCPRRPARSPWASSATTSSWTWSCRRPRRRPRRTSSPARASSPPTRRRRRSSRAWKFPTSSRPRAARPRFSSRRRCSSLKVTPQITPDNRIILDLDVRDDSVGQVVVASGGVNVPSINTREIATQVLVNDGQTVVLGGILSTTAARGRHQGALPR